LIYIITEKCHQKKELELQVQVNVALAIGEDGEYEYLSMKQCKKDGWFLKTGSSTNMHGDKSVL